MALRAPRFLFPLELEPICSQQKFVWIPGVLLSQEQATE